MLAEQLRAEYRVRTEGRGRVVDEWKIRSPGLGNHFLDGLVGCAVAASMQGAALAGTGESRPYHKRKRKRIKLSEIQAQKRAERDSYQYYYSR